jgi:hypothetical protein
VVIHGEYSIALITGVHENRVVKMLGRLALEYGSRSQKLIELADEHY